MLKNRSSNDGRLSAEDGRRRGLRELQGEKSSRDHSREISTTIQRPCRRNVMHDTLSSNDVATITWEGDIEKTAIENRLEKKNAANATRGLAIIRKRNVRVGI